MIVPPYFLDLTSQKFDNKYEYCWDDTFLEELRDEEIPTMLPRW